MALDLDKESELVSAWEIGFWDQGIKPEVFERVLNLCTQIALEGREGRQVGTIFVVGDSSAVLNNSKNLVLNPFYGYSEMQRNVMDLALEETVKEFATIDGAFIVNGDGTIETAGARILATAVGNDFPKGLGTRHAAAAAITAITNSIAFAVSQSTGNISIFKSGNLIAEVGQSSITQPVSNVQFAQR
jgi:DNA integrity scanning protein DisA with diadenylate cyclase activity